MTIYAILFLTILAIYQFRRVLLIYLAQIFRLICERRNNKKLIISIEGNIGVGKSTLLRLLEQKYSKIADFVEEPVGVWEEILDENGKNLLQLYYEDKKRWSYTFQNLANVTRLDIIASKLQNSKKPILILDRSLIADREIFARMLYDKGLMTKLEWGAYQKWNNFYEKFIAPDEKINIIYLSCSPDKAYSRIQLRGREAEKTIDLEYLESVHKYHQDWFERDRDKLNILTLDAEQDFEHNYEIRKDFMEQIEQFIKIDK